MRILIASHFYIPNKEGGAERVARRTAENLAARGHDVSVLAVRQAGHGPDADLDAQIPVHRFDYVKGDVPGIGPMAKGPVAKLAWHIRNGLGGVDTDQLAHALDKIQPDVIYAHNSRLMEPDLSRLAADRGIPMVMHLHDYGWMCPRNSMFRKGNSCAKPCLDCRALTSKWRTTAAPRDVIAVSQFVQGKYRSNGVFPGARWHVVRNTVSAPKQVTPPTQIKTFGFIGALAPDKGIEDLVRAFGSLDNPELHLRVAGSGADDYTNHLKSLAVDLAVSNQITWLGQVDKSAFYPSVDCVVVPSRWDEPQSLVLGESLSHKRPLIVSDRGGSTEVLNASQGGVLFDPATDQGLAGALRHMAGRDASEFSCTLSGVLPDEFGFTTDVESILHQAITP